MHICGQSNKKNTNMNQWINFFVLSRETTIEELYKLGVSNNIGLEK